MLPQLLPVIATATAVPSTVRDMRDYRVDPLMMRGIWSLLI